MRAQLLSRTGALRVANLPEGPLQLRGEIDPGFAIPAQVRLVESGAVQGGGEVAACGIATKGLSLRQLPAQGRHPAAQRAKEAAAEVRFLEHEAQHLPGLAGVLNLFFHGRDHGVFHGGQRIARLRLFGKALRDALSAMLHAVGEQFFLGAEVAEEGAAGDAGTAADLGDSGAIETHVGEKLPGGLLDLAENKLVFPFAKRPGILCFRPLFAAGRGNCFLHSMQIMAQRATL